VARHETTSTPYAGETPARTAGPEYDSSTTWLRYVPFSFAPVLPAELDRFLRDAVNRDAVIADFLQQSGQWAAAVKVELPLQDPWPICSPIPTHSGAVPQSD
jgi:hypothetical protein